ncbi:MAG: hypothetical protein WBG77_07590 [Acinetobacter venetianus]|uniref:hypothetical protein n=1 Tax=Acinetobacter venetianus TaxID=52133 RepID=UPI003C7096F9
MKLLFLIILAYLVMPIVGLFTVYLTDIPMVAGDVTKGLIIYNIVFVLIVLIVVGSFFIHEKTVINFFDTNKDYRTLKRTALVMTCVCVVVFYMSGYDYLIKNVHRGEIRVSFGAFGFLNKWLTIYVVPLLLALTTLIKLNGKIKSKLYLYIYILGVLSAIFTGYKYVVILVFIPSLAIIFYNKNVIKISLYISPVVLGVLTVTTKMVMNFESYKDAFNFLLHRMTVMSVFGTVGVYNTYPTGAEWSESHYLIYSIFGNNLNNFLFGIDFNTIDGLQTNLSRKISYLVYPSWDKVLSGETNVTVTNFGEAFYIFGYNFWIYAILCSIVTYFIFHKINYYAGKGQKIGFLLYLTFFTAIVLSWFNSSSFFILLSIPTIVYMIMSYFLLILILRSKV